MKGGCSRQRYGLGVPAGQLVGSAAWALLPALLRHVPRRQRWAEPAGPSIINKQGIMPRHASHKEGRGSLNFMKAGAMSGEV